MKTRIALFGYAVIISVFLLACDVSSVFPALVPVTPTIDRQSLPQPSPATMPTGSVIINTPIRSSSSSGVPQTVESLFTITPTSTLTAKATFWVDNNNTNLDAGSCTIVHWNVTEASKVFYQNQPVANAGEQKECFGAARHYDLILRMVMRNGSEQQQVISINVSKSTNPGAGQSSQISSQASSSQSQASQSSAPQSSSSSQASSSQSSIVVPVNPTTVPVNPTSLPVVRTIVPNPSPHPITQRQETPTAGAVSYSVR